MDYKKYKTVIKEAGKLGLSVGAFASVINKRKNIINKEGK